MPVLALLLLLGPLQEAEALRSEVNRLRSEVALLQGALRERDALLGTVREELAGVRGDLRELRERPEPRGRALPGRPSRRVRPPRGRGSAVLAPRVEVESFRRHDTVLLKVRRVEAGAVRTVAEVELTPDADGVDLPIDQSGALYIVEWATSEGHVYNLVLRDGASGQPRPPCP
jgi:hypothetical protein